MGTSEHDFDYISGSDDIKNLDDKYHEAVKKITSAFTSTGEIKKVCDETTNYVQVEEISRDLGTITTTSDSISFIREPEDKVNHPNHYTQGGIEAIDAIEAAVTGLVGSEATNTSNTLKYMWRWKFKNGIEDIKKAIWYAVRLCFSINKKITVEYLRKLLKEYESKL